MTGVGRCVLRARRAVLARGGGGGAVGRAHAADAAALAWPRPSSAVPQPRLAADGLVDAGRRSTSERRDDLCGHRRDGACVAALLCELREPGHAGRADACSRLQVGRERRYVAELLGTDAAGEMMVRGVSARGFAQRVPERRCVWDQSSNDLPVTEARANVRSIAYRHL